MTDSILLQNDLRQLEQWTEKWQLALNPDECKVMHIGHDYTTAFDLQQNGKPKVFDESYEEKDLGIYVTTDLKPSASVPAQFLPQDAMLVQYMLSSCVHLLAHLSIHLSQASTVPK